MSAGAAEIFEAIVMRLELVIGDAPILDRHVLRQEAGAVAFGEMRARDEVRRQKPPGLRIPVHAAAADAVRRHEGAPAADRQRRLVHLVAEGEGGLLRPQEQLVADAIAQFVGRIARRMVGRRVAPGAALDCNHIEAGLGKLVGHDRSGPAETDDDDVLCRQLAGHALCLVRGPVRAPDDADGRMRIAFVVTADPVAIVVADAGKADHLPADHVAIAAMDGIGEEAFRHVLQQRAEKALRVDAVEFDLAGFDLLQRVVLLLG